jgi:Rieske Fe-S protein
MRKKHQKRKIDSDRRAFLKTTGLCGGAVMLTAIPLATYFIAPALKKATGKWVDFGAVEDLLPASIQMLSYEFMFKDGWLVLPQRGFVWAKIDNDRNIKVFSSTCTHLACNVIWREETNSFECPCHSGRFDANGQPIAGPPTKPLRVLAHKIEDKKLMVHLTV